MTEAPAEWEERLLGLEMTMDRLKNENARLREKAEKWDELKNIVPKLEERLRLLEKLKDVREWAESWIDRETTWSRGKALWNILGRN